MNIEAFSAGQRLVVGFDGTELNADLMFLIDTIKVGGIILFSRNLSGPDQIKKLCFSVQEYARSCGQPRLFIAIDQEGGQVARLKAPFTQFPGNPMIKEEADAVHFAEVTAAELTEAGINMNMAPVMDVVPQTSEVFETSEVFVMEARAFGSDPEWVANMGGRVITVMQNNGIMAVAKHFPGIGRTILDSHNDMPSLDVDMDDLAASDLLPFEAAVRLGVSGIMLSHILYNKVDPEWPASLSPTIVNALLRNRMGFDGIVMTDDLDMGAIKKHYDIRTVMQQILLADVDIALICYKGPDIENAFDEIAKGMKDSQEIKTRGDASVQRILKSKKMVNGEW